MGAVCQEILTEDPKTEQAVMAALKKYCSSQTVDSEDGRLLAYGYEPADLFRTDRNRTYILSFCGALAGGLLFLAAVFWRNQRENARIRALTDYVEQVNRGRGRILPGEREDAFSGLQDEICKTVTELYQTRDMAVKARDFFAENLANIAHQILARAASWTSAWSVFCRDGRTSWSSWIWRRSGSRALTRSSSTSFPRFCLPT